MDQNTLLNLSGERFSVTYQLACRARKARIRAREICIEQSVEFPEELLPPGPIRMHLVGRIEALETMAPGIHQATISYAIENTGYNLLQLMNVVFGNISIKPGVRVERVDLPLTLLQHFRGPRFGKDGLRQLLGIPERPLLCAAIKPIGLSLQALGEMAYQYALGGIDIVKDDHGLNDQPFSPFEARVSTVVEAIQRANHETGDNCIYFPTLLRPMERLQAMAYKARALGAGGLLIMPALLGLDTMRMLADDDNLALPIMSHPAFQGSYVIGKTIGMSHFMLYGQLVRLAGGDATVYPNFGGRFSHTRDECIQVVKGCRTPMGEIKPIFPTPGGGMTLERIPELMEVYDRDVLYLMGGGLHRGKDLVENCRKFRQMVEKM